MANNSKLPYILTTATLYSQDFEVTLISAFVFSSLQEQRDKKGFFHSRMGDFFPRNGNTAVACSRLRSAQHDRRSEVHNSLYYGVFRVG